MKLLGNQKELCLPIVRNDTLEKIFRMKFRVEQNRNKYALLHLGCTHVERSNEILYFNIADILINPVNLSIFANVVFILGPQRHTYHTLYRQWHPYAWEPIFSLQSLRAIPDHLKGLQFALVSHKQLFHLHKLLTTPWVLSMERPQPVLLALPRIWIVWAPDSLYVDGKSSILNRIQWSLFHNASTSPKCPSTRRGRFLIFANYFQLAMTSFMYFSKS